MNIVDSSGWLEYFADSGRAQHFAAAIENTEKLVIPVITMYEVFKKVLRESGESAALTCVAQMQQGRVVDIGIALAMSAARFGLPLADSLIYATARQNEATLWTQDAHFEGLPGVRYFAQKA